MLVSAVLEPVGCRLEQRHTSTRMGLEAAPAGILDTYIRWLEDSSQQKLGQVLAKGRILFVAFESCPNHS